MKIDSIDRQYSMNFSALKVAAARNLVSGSAIDIDLFKLGKTDLPFLEKLAQKTDFSKLVPSLSPSLRKRWQHILNYCITRAFKGENNSTYVAVSQNKVCGIMTFTKNENNEINLEGICSIPKRNGKKVPLVGKTFFYFLFKMAKEENLSGIRLNAVKDGPFEIVPKYEELGFKVCRGKDEEYTYMFCNKHKVLEQLKELPFLIKCMFKNDNKHTSLLKYLD